jgi:hypothetical protein
MKNWRGRKGDVCEREERDRGSLTLNFEEKYDYTMVV